VRELERAGVAALHLEDQTFPKRCGHYDDKSVVSPVEMAQKLRAARDAMTDADIVLIVRTDALAVEDLDAAIERGQAYAAAGADVIFIEAPVSLAQIETIARRVPQPKLINMFLIPCWFEIDSNAERLMRCTSTCASGRRLAILARYLVMCRCAVLRPDS